jgi:predicted transcriptional regulator
VALERLSGRLEAGAGSSATPARKNYAASWLATMISAMPRTKQPGPPPPALHELETEVMEEVWRQGETTVKLVMEALNKKAKPARAYTTYMTVMRRLSDKGVLERTRSGRHDSYRPKLSRDEYQELRAGAEVRDLVDEFGDVALAHFARSLSSLDPARRRQLQRLASGR